MTANKTRTASPRTTPRNAPRASGRPPVRSAKRAPGTAAPARAASTPRHFRIDCTLGYELPQPTSFLFQVHAQHGRDQQVLAESLELTPGIPSHVFPDPLEHHRFLRLQAPAGQFTLRYQATVQLMPRHWDTQAAEVPVHELPDEVLHHLMATRYCESDLLCNAAHKIFGQHPPGYQRVQAIVDWVHDNIDYRLGSSNATTTACDVFRNRAGVCRDFAHLAVTFCRALNIPARLVVGYARFDDPPPDFHAVFEAYLGGEWMMFDPTRMSPVEDMVRIAAGRDAKDLAFSTIFGQANMLTMAPLIEQVD
ncbi:transglutaminase family protein [Aquincola sp. MAHUQ-54]|uniref:Transglutaminase family protein n=1 Tax=Aquincola agrisoli TaxID=3119538 RepID=A0AAW9QRI5_9BURK